MDAAWRFLLWNQYENAVSAPSTRGPLAYSLYLLMFCQVIYKRSQEHGRTIQKRSKYYLMHMFLTAFINCAAAL